MYVSALRSPARLVARLGLNGPLLVGGVAVLGLIVCAFAARLLAPHSPLDPVIIAEGGRFAPTPYPPGTPETPLGSDTLRRDMLSRLLYGSRFTLLFCGLSAIVRVLIGAALGMIAGWYPGMAGPIGGLAAASSAVPSLLFALVPLVVVNSIGTPDDSVRAFVIVLSLTGWAETTARVRAAVEALAGKPFIESAFAVGLRRRQVLLRHVLPNLRDVLLVELAFAMGAVLLLVAELAFLNVFAGGAAIDQIGGRVLAVDTIEAEWGNMLARGLRERGAGYWMFLEPMLAFVGAIAAFNLLAEGLRRR